MLTLQATRPTTKREKLKNGIARPDSIVSSNPNSTIGPCIVSGERSEATANLLNSDGPGARGIVYGCKLNFKRLFPLR